MADYVISCCSTVDLDHEYMVERDIKYVCFNYELDGKAYKDDLGQGLSMADFYQAMVDGAMTRTFQVNAEDYAAYFEGFLSQGLDVIHLTLSSGISGTYNSAMIAREEVAEKYPDRKIYVIDSLCASAGFGLIMDKLADLREQGKTIDELAKWTEENRLKCNHWFFSSDLTFFIRGGRISKTAGTIGQVLNICPLMNVDYKGALIVREKIRTKKKVIKAIVEKMEALCENGPDYDQKVFISNAACQEDAQAVADLIIQKWPQLEGKVKISSIGPTIGSHTGPGTVALFFWGKERVD